MKYGWWLVAAMMIAGTAQAGVPTPPPEVLKAAQRLLIDADPIPQPGEIVKPRPDMPDARAVKTWLKLGYLRPVKLTPGPRPDWLIDTERAADLGAYYCGTGGCLLQIWGQAGGGYTKIFDNQVRAYHFRWIGRSGRTWMDADFHGSMCGQAGVVACPWGFEWRDDGLGRAGLLVSLRFARQPGLHPGPPPQGLDPMNDPDASGVPGEIRQLITNQETACQGWQGTYEPGGLVNRLPDLNGDGIDDWSYQGRLAYCNFPRDPADSSGKSTNPHADSDPCTVLDCENIVWLSRRDGTGVTWDRAPLDAHHAFALRYSRKGVVLEQLDNLPGVTDDSPDACDTFTIETCAETPISLSPRP